MSFRAKLMRAVRSAWTVFRGGRPCYVCGRQALDASFDGRFPDARIMHAEHLIEGVSAKESDG